MTLEQAAAILKRHDGDMHEMAAASAYVHSYYTTEGKHLMRPANLTTDAAPRKRKPMTDAQFDEALVALRRLIRDKGKKARTRDAPAAMTPIAAARGREVAEQAQQRALAARRQNFWSRTNG